MITDRLNPFIAELLQQLEQDEVPPMNVLGVGEARQLFEDLWPDLLGPPEEVASVKNTPVPGPAGEIPLRIYTPDGEAPFPILVYVHGGGFVIGSLDTHDRVCRSLANAAACIVVSVDYRLAPESKYPAAVEDSYAATCWVADNAASIQGDPSRIAIGGDSAGGNLSAVVALMARGEGAPPLVFQLLIYPATDVSSLDTGSYRAYGDMPTCRKEDIEWYCELYLASAQEALDPRVSPLLAPDLSGLPPAMVITAEFDVLRDEGKAYADRLAQAGVPVEYVCGKGMVHGFFGLAGIDRSENGIDTAVKALRAAFA